MSEITEILIKRINHIWLLKYLSPVTLREHAKKIETEILDEFLGKARRALCQYCRDGGMPSKITNPRLVRIRGRYAHRLHDHDYVCEADLLIRRMESDE